ncbi:hypothetical protein KAU45_04800 [bacterium]|nr:hypothetical protein [bacterium]
MKKQGFRIQDSGFRGVLMLIALFATFALACGSSTDSDDDDDLEDDDSAQTNDDDSGDDDTVEGCAEIWLECEYNNPSDYVPDACGERVESGGYENCRDFFACFHRYEADRFKSLASCGYDQGCDDWKYFFYNCNQTYYEIQATCYEESETNEAFNECRSEYPDLSTQDCYDI